MKIFGTSKARRSVLKDCLILPREDQPKGKPMFTFLKNGTCVVHLEGYKISPCSEEDQQLWAKVKA